MKKKLGKNSEVTIKATTYQDGVFAAIMKYQNDHEVGFSVAVHEVVTAGLDAATREQNLTSEADHLQNEISLLQAQLSDAKKAMNYLGGILFQTGNYIPSIPENEDLEGEND